MKTHTLRILKTKHNKKKHKPLKKKQPVSFQSYFRLKTIMTKLKGQTSLEMSWEPETGAVPDPSSVIRGVGLHVQNTDQTEGIRQTMRGKNQAPDESGVKQAPLW